MIHKARMFLSSAGKEKSQVGLDNNPLSQTSVDTQLISWPHTCLTQTGISQRLEATGILLPD